MKIILTGGTGGIGSAIRDQLENHDLTWVAHADVDRSELEDVDWLICAHGVLNENDILGTFMANTITSIYLAEHMQQGSVIFISSTAAINGNSGYPVYAASKAALNTYCKSKSNCYALCPGPTDTAMWRKLGLPGKAQDPKEVAKAVQMIIDGEFHPGHIITVRNGEITL